MRQYFDVTSNDILYRIARPGDPCPLHEMDIIEPGRLEAALAPLMLVERTSSELKLSGTDRAAVTLDDYLPKEGARIDECNIIGEAPGYDNGVVSVELRRLPPPHTQPPLPCEFIGVKYRYSGLSENAGALLNAVAEKVKTLYTP